MLARLQGYTIQIIRKKDTEFAEAASCLSKNSGDEETIADALHRKQPVFGIYDKNSKLCEWFLMEKEHRTFVLKQEHLDKKIPLILETQLENLILQELLSEAVFHGVKEIEWHRKTYPVNAGRVWTSALLGVLFGIVMGIVFGFVTKQKPIEVIVGILWAAACAMIFGSQELCKQQDALNEQRLNALHLKKSI